MSHVLDRFAAFGWVIARCGLRAGESFRYESRQGVPRAQASSLAIYTRGRIEVRRGWARLDDRTPGLFTGERPDIKPGLYLLKAMEDSEWWCIDACLNERRRPKAGKVALAPGQSGHFPAGSRLFIAAGEFGLAGKRHLGPVPIEATRPLELTAITAVYGFDLGPA